MCRGWAIRHDQSNKCMQDANTTSFHGLRLRKFLHAFRDLARATNQSRNLGCHLLAGVVTLGLHVAWYFQTHSQAMPPWLLPWQKLFQKHCRLLSSVETRRQSPRFHPSSVFNQSDNWANRIGADSKNGVAESCSISSQESCVPDSGTLSHHIRGIKSG